MTTEIFSQKNELENKAISFTELPKGVALGTVRDCLSPGTQLMVRFSSPTMTDKSVAFSVGDERYNLSLLDTYVVTPNDSGTPWVYLNPLTQNYLSVAEESNIPQSLDAALATIFSYRCMSLSRFKSSSNWQ